MTGAKGFQEKMSKLAQKSRKTAPAAEAGGAASDGGKKGEILDGARRVFRAEGFDGASMDKIAQAARVSKGTLYVYFRNKEELFKELVRVDRREAAEQLCGFDDDTGAVADVLQRLGESFVAMMVRPEHIALIRMVMGAAEKFPEAGQVFFDTGPRYGIGRLAAYLQRQVERGNLKIDDDIELAAAHFLNLCQGNLVKPRLFGSVATPAPEEVRRTVESAVRVFLRSYGAQQS